MFEESKKRYREAVQAYLKATEGKRRFPFRNLMKTEEE